MTATVTARKWLWIYNTAFSGMRFEYGYASALAWVLFIIVGVLTIFIFRTSKWVYYGEES